MSIILDGDTGVSTLQNHEQITVDSSGNVTLSPGSILYTPRADGTRSGEFYTDNSGTWLKSSISGNDPVYIDTTGGALRVQNNGADTLTVDNNGRVTMPYQPAFTVGIPGNVSSSQSGSTVTTWTTAKSGCFDRGNNMGGTYFTAPIAGVYHFDVSVLFNSGTTENWCGTYILVNDSIVVDSLGGSYQTAYDYQLINRSINLQLQIGDMVSIQLRDDGGDGFIYDGNIYSWFSGHLIG